MNKALFILPIVFFIALTGLLVSYSAATAPVEYPAVVSAAPASTASDLPLLLPYPELEGIVINVNTATAAELEQLPGIGPEKSKAIQEYVSENGPLTSVDDLLNVKGIGKKILENIQPYITVDTEPS